MRKDGRIRRRIGRLTAWGQTIWLPESPGGVRAAEAKEHTCLKERDRENGNDPADPEAYSYSAEFQRDPDPADRCPDCRDRGRILLLLSTVPCQACRGRGFRGEARLAAWTTIARFEDPEEGGRTNSYDVTGPDEAP